MGNKDYYNTLGVNKNASVDEIKAAYKKNVLKWHPDRWSNKSEGDQKKAEEKFKEIAEAYEVLSDKDKKAQYDMFGTTDFSSGGFSTSSTSADDIFAEFMHKTGFGNFGGFRQKRTTRHYKGSDKKISISVTLEDVYFNRSKTVHYNVEKPCKECNGKGTHGGGDVKCRYCGGSGYVTETQRFNGGMFQNTQPCPYCKGTGILVDNPCHHCSGSGVVSENVKQTFVVPNIDELQYTYKIDGGGNACHNAMGSNGDLYYMFSLKEDSSGKFKVDGENISNICTTIDVDVFDCLMGCEKVVETIDGKKLKFKIPKGTRDGSEFVLNRHGLKLSNGLVGNLVVRLKMIMPKLSDGKIAKIRKILEEK